MSRMLFSLGEEIFYYNKWSDQIEHGEIINIRKSNLNWDYKIRYQIYSDMYYIHWIEEKHIGREEQVLFKFLKK